MRDSRVGLTSRQPAPPSARTPVAVLIDGSALYQAIHSPSLVPDDRRFNYIAFVDLLVNKVAGLEPGGPGSSSLWTMMTSADPRNTGQAKFLEFAETRLGWDVRTALPIHSFMVEPQLLFGVGQADSLRNGRLIRFDASIAFAMGRLAETHRLVVASDSFPLALTMLRVSELWEAKTGRPVLTFFGRALEPRWHGVLRGQQGLDFVDLDDHLPALFGTQETEVQQPARKAGSVLF